MGEINSLRTSVAHLSDENARLTQTLTSLQLRIGEYEQANSQLEAYAHQVTTLTAELDRIKGQYAQVTTEHNSFMVSYRDLELRL